MWKGGGEGYLDVVLLTLGTGVGGGIIINGEIAPSHRGVGGELGHITVNPDEEMCIRDRYFVLNYKAQACEITLKKKVTDRLTGNEIEGTYEVAPYGVLVLL